VHGGLVGVIPTTGASVSVYPTSPDLRERAYMCACIRVRPRRWERDGGEGEAAGRRTGACGCTWIDTRCDRVRV